MNKLAKFLAAREQGRGPMSLQEFERTRASIMQKLEPIISGVDLPGASIVEKVAIATGCTVRDIRRELDAQLLADAKKGNRQ